LGPIYGPLGYSREEELEAGDILANLQGRSKRYQTQGPADYWSETSAPGWKKARDASRGHYEQYADKWARGPIARMSGWDRKEELEKMDILRNLMGKSEFHKIRTDRNQIEDEILANLDAQGALEEIRRTGEARGAAPELPAGSGITLISLEEAIKKELANILK
jgi:hypothetical protein